ncbi:MAG: phosphatidate cytidylyltransferase [Gemmatimonadetes bacterium]|nr:phosphatidate cytidylyltransferase [Gemmatimonadota bacterium]
MVAAVGIPAAFGLVYLGGWMLAAVLAALGALGAAELYRLAARRQVRPLAAAGWVGAGLVPLAAFASLPDGLGIQGRWIVLGGAAWLMGVMLLAMASRAPSERPLLAVSVTVFGALYAGGLPTFLLWLRYGSGVTSPWAGTWLVFLPLALTWIGDTLAMIGGALMGRARLAPVLSPNKTWAGAVWGALGAAVAAPLYGRWVLGPVGVEFRVWELVLVGGAVGVLGQLGDLAESLFKREAGVKDSGTFFPGHGGVLDRLDSLYWAIPVTVILLQGLGRI